MQMHSHIKLRVLGQTIDGRNMDLLQVGDDEAGQPRKKRVWLVARQHPEIVKPLLILVHCASKRKLALWWDPFRFAVVLFIQQPPKRHSYHFPDNEFNQAAPHQDVHLKYAGTTTKTYSIAIL
eukprot:scaffold41095_cov17-Tisochrysis_lutea.AAC.1